MELDIGYCVGSSELEELLDSGVTEKELSILDGTLMTVEGICSADGTREIVSEDICSADGTLEIVSEDICSADGTLETISEFSWKSFDETTCDGIWVSYALEEYIEDMLGVD